MQDIFPEGVAKSGSSNKVEEVYAAVPEDGQTTEMTDDEEDVYEVCQAIADQLQSGVEYRTRWMCSRLTRRSGSRCNAGQGAATRAMVPRQVGR